MILDKRRKAATPEGKTVAYDAYHGLDKRRKAATPEGKTVAYDAYYGLDKRRKAATPEGRHNRNRLQVPERHAAGGRMPS